MQRSPDFYKKRTIEKTPNFAKIILITCTSHRQNFSAMACFRLELLGYAFIHILYIYALFQKLIKTEQTIEKSPNFQPILFNFQTSFSQNINVVPAFVLKLLGFVFYTYTIILCFFRN